MLTQTMLQLDIINRINWIRLIYNNVDVLFPPICFTTLTVLLQKRLQQRFRPILFAKVNFVHLYYTIFPINQIFLMCAIYIIYMLLYLFTNQIFANVQYVHHDEKVWGDPWNFRPERFLDEDGQLLPRGHVLRKKYYTFCM